MHKIWKCCRPFPAGLGIRRKVAPFHLTDRSLKHCIDFAMPIGTPVLAAQDGTVIEVVNNFKKNYTDTRFADRCNYIILRHPDGNESIYVHLMWHSSRVKSGEIVQAGQIIALSGNTGYATYPHLHFGAYDFQGKNIPIIFHN